MKLIRYKPFPAGLAYSHSLNIIVCYHQVKKLCRSILIIHEQLPWTICIFSNNTLEYYIINCILLVGYFLVTGQCQCWIYYFLDTHQCKIWSKFLSFPSWKGSIKTFQFCTYCTGKQYNTYFSYPPLLSKMYIMVSMRRFPMWLNIRTKKQIWKHL